MSIPTVAVTCIAHDQQGNPVAGGAFRAKLDRTEIYNGFVVPEVIEGTADANGVCVLNLWPNALGVNSSSYRIRAWNPDTGAKYLDAQAVVPNSDCLLQNIIQVEPFPPLDQTQQALIAVQASVAEAYSSANDASSSADAAAASAAGAAVSAGAASASASGAADSATAAGASASGAATSASAAAASQAAAAASEGAVATSAATASTKASEASTSAALASAKATDASNSAAAAAASETAAASSASTASTQASQAAASASSASTSASTATTQAGIAATKAAEASASAGSALASEALAAASASAAADGAAAAAISEASAAADAATATTQAGIAAAKSADAEASALSAAESASTATANAGEASASAAAAATQAGIATVKASEAAASAASAFSSEAASAASASAASDSALAAAASESSVASDAATASDQAGIATTQAGIATAQAESAALSESIATTAAGTATTKAEEAAASAILAADGAAASQTAKAAAEAAWDSFDDIYLGVKTAFPTTDNDGNPLVDGALFYHGGVSPKQLYIWTGIGWDQAAFSASGAVLSFNSRSGAVTLSAADVTSALSFTPYDASNPAGYLASTNLKTVNGQSVVGSGNIQIDGGVTSFNTRTGAIELTSGDVTGALGFAPYDASNPAAYVDAAGARSAISVTGAATYNSLTGVINVAGGVTSVNGQLGDVSLSTSDITNDSGYITGAALAPYLLSATAASTYQPTLISGTNIKTVNGQSVLGSGNIQIDGGVTSFNTRAGAVTLTSGDVTDALGFTPATSQSQLLGYYAYTATAGQTLFSGAAANGQALAYDPGGIIVTLNGVTLGVDEYTATDGTSVVLASGAAVGDALVVRAFQTATVANTYTQAQTDTLLAARASLTGAETLTNKTIIGGVYGGVIDQTGSQRSGVVAVPALDIDCSAGNYFTKAISGNSTFTFSNAPAARAYSFTLELTHASGAVTWPTAVQWPGGMAPTLTAGKTSLLMFVTDDGGTRWRGAALMDYTT